MSTHKKIDAVCIAAILLTIALTVLFMNGEAFGIARAAGGDEGGMFTGNDLNADWDASSATKITLSDGGSTVSGNGAYTYNGDVYIVYPGRYVLSGELTDGSVTVNAGSTDKIWILLDAAAIRCEDGAALRIEQADKVFLTLAEGTKSTLSSGGQYSEEASGAGVDGVIYSRDDLTINGNGALEISAEYKHGIVCNDDLAVTGGTITITATQDGIHANDSVRLRDAALSISAGDDGIAVSNDDESAFLYVESGSITIPACYEGLEAASITIAGGTINIVSTDDGINASGNGANSVIRVTGGDIMITNPSGRDADGLDSNGSIYIEGGRILISVADGGGNCALDYGSENGGECVISGGTVAACGGSSMAEGFDAGSPQGFLMVNRTGAAGAEITLEDASGQTLLSGKIPCAFSSAVLSAPGLKVGDVCTLTVDGVREQVTIDNTSSSGFFPAGMFRGGMGGMKNGQDGGRMFDGEGKPFDGGESPGDPFSGSDTQPPEDQTGGPQSGFQPGDRQGGGNLPDRQEGRGSFRQEMSAGAAPAAEGMGGVLLLAVSIAILLAGLAVAFKFKR